jgi:type VI secretion system protein ImpG
LKKLRTYYERELATLHGFCQEFATAFPAQAHQLGMAAGTGDDPHIARFIQASALSNARIARLIDDNDSKFTEALLSVNYPHYVQPFPSAAIVCARNTAAGDTLHRLPAGTMMTATTDDGQACRFRSAWDVLLAPVVLADASFAPSCHTVSASGMAPAATAAISIAIAGASARTCLEQLDIPALRIFIDAEPSLRANLRDALLMHAQCAQIELPDGARIALSELPLQPVGFAAHEALVPGMAASHPALRLLTEYFVFPDKFHFFDIAWPVLAQHLPEGCRAFTLHVGLSGIDASSPAARNLAALSGRHFVLGCTPVVNLFPLGAQPIEWRHDAADYPLLPAADPGQFCDIHSVTGVTALRTEQGASQLAEFRPFYSLRHGEDSTRRGRYYLLRRDPVMALTRPQLAMRIAFVDTRLEPLSMADASMSISLLCTNGDMPCPRLP